MSQIEKWVRIIAVIFVAAQVCKVLINWDISRSERAMKQQEERQALLDRLAALESRLKDFEHRTVVLEMHEFNRRKREQGRPFIELDDEGTPNLRRDTAAPADRG